MKKYFYILGSLQALTAPGAIPAGLGYLLDTTGKGMGVTIELLEKSPFKSFLIPGLFLLLVNGLGNAAGAYLSFKRKKLAGNAGLILGIILSLWIIIQVMWITLSSFSSAIISYYLELQKYFWGLRILRTKSVN